jgi:hypothetical protein
MALFKAQLGTAPRTEDGDMRNVIVGLLVVCGLLVVGCKKRHHGGGAGHEIGVAECDEYITKYSACIEKMPATSKSTAEAGFKAQIQAWKASSATPEGKATLKTGCKITLDSLATNPLCK